MTALILRWLLLVYLIVMYVLAMLYLRNRRMSLSNYGLWGLFALLVPMLGPFVVIAFQPGKSAVGKPRRSRRRSP